MGPVARAFYVFVEGFELGGYVGVEVAEGDDVDVNPVFFETFGEFFDVFGGFGEGGAGEDDDALVLGFVLAVLEGELGGWSVVCCWKLCTVSSACSEYVPLQRSMLYSNDCCPLSSSYVAHPGSCQSHSSTS